MTRNATTTSVATSFEARARNVFSDKPADRASHIWRVAIGSEPRALCDFQPPRRRSISPDATLKPSRICSVCARKDGA